MSKDLKDLPQESEEVDLGQLFSLIGNIFTRLFRFIGNILNKCFLGFVWLVFFVKKHLVKLLIAAFIGLALGVLLEKISQPVYQSYTTIKQNYRTGENLYNSITYYNDLVKQNDIKTLASTLEIDTISAATILKFEIQSVISEDQKIKNYNEYIKELDSTIAASIDYETYLDYTKDYDHRLQQIAIKAKARNNFKAVFEKIIENLETNKYFKREQEKDLEELKNEELALNMALVKSDSLQSTYKRVLEKVLDKRESSQTSITIESSDDTDKTKEFDLYLNDLELRQELVKNLRNQADKKYIIETISSKQDSGTIDNTKKIFGFEFSNKIAYGILAALFMFFVLLFREFIIFLQRYKDLMSQE